ncbi:hypothetical protein SD78_3973 [Bacillus badius]|nr:hypothetical protein SD78_3973 [Bacillus badius]
MRENPCKRSERSQFAEGDDQVEPVPDTFSLLNWNADSRFFSLSIT